MEHTSRSIVQLCMIHLKALLPMYYGKKIKSYKRGLEPMIPSGEVNSVTSRSSIPLMVIMVFL